MIGQDIWSGDFYQITNEQNPVYLRALSAFKDGSFEKYGIETADVKKKEETILEKIRKKKANRKNK